MSSPRLFHPAHKLFQAADVPGRTGSAVSSLGSDPVTLNVCWPHLHAHSLWPEPSSFYLPPTAGASALPLPGGLAPASLSLTQAPALSLSASSVTAPPMRETPAGEVSCLSPVWVSAGRDGPSNTRGPPSQALLPLPRSAGPGGWHHEVLSATLHQVAATADPRAEGTCFCTGGGCHTRSRAAAGGEALSEAALWVVAVACEPAGRGLLPLPLRGNAATVT